MEVVADMSDVLRTIDHMRARGVAAEAILEAVYALEASRADKLESRREADRQRQRLHRMKQKDPVSPVIVSRDTSTVTPGETPDPQGFSPTPSLPKPPVSPSLSLSGADTRADRLEALRDLQQNHWQEIAAVCKARVNGSMAATPAAADYSPILRLMAPSEGEPCDLQADILPAIDFKVAQSHQTGKPIKAWSWIEERALQNRDRRLAGVPAPEKPNERAGQGQSGRPANGRGNLRAGAGREHGTAPLDAAWGRLFGDDQAPADVSDEPIDGRAYRLA